MAENSAIHQTVIYIDYSGYMDINHALDALAALSQKTRLETFKLLVEEGHEGLLAGEIAERLGVLQNTMSTHLNILLKAELVRKERQGRAIRYCVDIQTMQGLLAYLVQDCCGGKPELCQSIIAQVSCAPKEDHHVR